MAIKGVQPRLRRLGNIRTGDRGGRNGAPRKLETFRLTSPNVEFIKKAASLWGGEPTGWDGQGHEDWQVTTETADLPVLLPAGDNSLVDSWLELWSQGGCKRRCDGSTEVLERQPCLCDPVKRECQPVTRVDLLLPDIEGFGAWRLTTGSWHAAAELLAVGQILGSLTGMVRGSLKLEQREQRTAGQPVKKFAVPVIDMDVVNFLAGPTRQAALPPAPAPVTEQPPNDQPDFGEQLGEAVDQLEEASKAAPEAKVERDLSVRPIFEGPRANAGIFMYEVQERLGLKAAQVCDALAISAPGEIEDYNEAWDILADLVDET